MRSRSTLACFAVILGGMSLAAPARARGDGGEPSPADKETARALLAEGDRRFGAADARGALKAYEDADAIMHVPTTSVEVAKAQAALGLLVEAKDTCARIARTPIAASEPAPFAEARARCRDLVAQVSTRIATLVVAVSGVRHVDAIVVAVDDAPSSGSSGDVLRRVNPGTHRVRVSAPGYAAVEREAIAEEGHTTRVEVTMAPLPIAASSRPRAEPEVTPPASPNVRAPVPTYAWVGFGVGAVGLVAGSTTGILALTRAGAARERCNGNVCNASAQPDIDASLTLSRVSNVAFGCALVGGAVGVLGVVLRGTRREAPIAAFVSGTGAGVRGAF